VLQELSTAAAVLAEKLRAELLDGTLPPGTPLREEALAERFGAGRYTVRSALRLLVTAGLLEHEVNRGARVPELSPARVDELYEYRTILETGSLRAGLARRLPLTPVEEASAALVALALDTPWPEVIGAHQEIHRSIVRWSGSTRLLDAYAACEQELEYVVASTRPDYTGLRLAELHTGLLDRLRVGGERAVSALTRDIEIGRKAVHKAVGRKNMLQLLDGPIRNS
jgi:DNA-binding GntR family transcriptional regulator